MLAFVVEDQPQPVYGLQAFRFPNLLQNGLHASIGMDAHFHKLVVAGAVRPNVALVIFGLFTLRVVRYLKRKYRV